MSWFKKSVKRWIGAWFQIFDCLVYILTLESYFCGTVAWWYGHGFDYGKEPLLTTGERITWWIFDWISIFEELLVILTLGQLCTSYLGARFLDWSR